MTRGVSGRVTRQPSRNPRSSRMEAMSSSIAIRRAPTARPSRRRRSRSFRGWRALRRAPAGIRIGVAVLAVLISSVTVNWIYQVVRKPSELLFPVSGALYKTPTETWSEYAPLFRHYSTAVMTPDLLAAIAQVEGSGNPAVRTYWRWSWKLKPFEIYRPASSAVGMYQITDGTFADARRYCVREHAVAEQGAWNDGQSCWFNGLYSRLLPAHAVELTAAYLDREVATIVERRRVRSASLHQKQALATLIHLCGAGAGDAYARRGFKLTPGQRCGDHEARFYLARVNAMKGVFDQIAAE